LSQNVVVVVSVQHDIFASSYQTTNTTDPFILCDRKSRNSQGLGLIDPDAQARLKPPTPAASNPKSPFSDQ